MVFPLINRGHGRYRRLLSEQLDSRIGARAQARLDAHLASCSRCRREAAGLRQTVALLRALPVVDAPRGFALSRVPSMEQRPARRWSLAPVRSLQVATAVSALALVALVSADLAGAFGGGTPESFPSRALLRADVAGTEEMAAADALAPQASSAPADADMDAFTTVEDAPAAKAAAEAPLEEEVESFDTAEPGSGAMDPAADPPAGLELPQPESGRGLDEWLLLVVALTTAALALGVTVWTWRLPSGPPG